MTEDPGQILAEEDVEIVEPGADDPIDVTRGDDGYDDFEEGAVDEVPQPSVYSAEEVGGIEPEPGKDS